jgi:hypothetical protein
MFEGTIEQKAKELIGLIRRNWERLDELEKRFERPEQRTFETASLWRDGIKELRSTIAQYIIELSALGDNEGWHPSERLKAAFIKKINFSNEMTKLWLDNSESGRGDEVVQGIYKSILRGHRHNFFK